MIRDPETQAQFLREAERLAGWRSEKLEDTAAARLLKGAIEYGENQFLTADCIGEAMEEAVDGAGGWLALEHQKNILDDKMEHNDLLLIAAAHFVQAYRVLEEYRIARRG